MRVEEIFKGVFKIDGKLATRNLVRGNTVYGERLLEENGREYRMWDPYRSKLSAAIMKGMQKMAIGEGSKVLYLGAATGTTCSHVSDIVGDKGELYAVELSERNARELVKMSERRTNILPIMQDARNTEAYAADVGEVDVLYQDVAARDQDFILLKNAELLKGKGFAYVAIKSQSIDVGRNPKEIYKEFLTEISKEFDVLEQIDIKPYDDAHLFVVLRKKA